MLKLSTKHTMEVGETFLEHLVFTIRISKHMIISSILLLIHGLTGGFYKMPEKFDICATSEKLLDAKNDRIKKKVIERYKNYKC